MRSLARQLQRLRHDPSSSGTGDDGDGPGLQELVALVGEVQLVVPSLLAVSLVRTRLDVPVALVLLTPEPGSAPARASLAVDLPSSPGSRTLLVLQAADPGAFLLLADQLHGPLPSRPTTLRRPDQQLDQHLRLPTDDDCGALTSALAELSLIDQATGVLIGRGLPPAAAVADLRERALLTSASLPQASRALLAEVAEAADP